MTAEGQREPQQARSRKTRARLLEAAVGLLAEDGLEGFSTAAIAGRAGLSKGALFQHFPNREAVVVAAVEQIFGAHRERIRRREKRLHGATGRDRVRSYLRMLLQLMREPEYLGALQVLAAARTNEHLAAALSAVATEQAGLAATFGESLLESAGASPGPRLRALSSVVLYSLEGVASDQALGRDRREADGVVEMLTELIAPALTEAAGARPRRNKRTDRPSATETR